MAARFLTHGKPILTRPWRDFRALRTPGNEFLTSTMVKHRTHPVERSSRICWVRCTAGASETLFPRSLVPLVPWSLVPCLLHFDRQFCRQDVHGRKPAPAQGAQAQCVVALGQAAAVVVHHQAAVVPGRILESQRAI